MQTAIDGRAGKSECQCSNCTRLKFNPVHCSKGHLCDDEYCATCSCFHGKCVDYKPHEVVKA